MKIFDNEIFAGLKIFYFYIGMFFLSLLFFLCGLFVGSDYEIDEFSFNTKFVRTYWIYGVKFLETKHDRSMKEWSDSELKIKNDFFKLINNNVKCEGEYWYRVIGTTAYANHCGGSSFGDYLYSSYKYRVQNNLNMDKLTFLVVSYYQFIGSGRKLESSYESYFLNEYNKIRDEK